MKFSVFSISALLMASVFLSCKPETPTPDPEPETILEAKLQLVYNGANVALDQTLFTQEGYPFQVREMKIILTQIKSGERNLLDASKMDM